MNNKVLENIQKTLKKMQVDMATKDDLKQLRKDIKEDIVQASMDVFKSADENKVEKIDLEALETRVYKLEQEVFN